MAVPQRLLLCFRGETRCGRAKWLLAAFMLLSLLLGLRTPTGLIFVYLAATPGMFAMIWLVVGWQWQRMCAPFVDGPYNRSRAKLRRPLIALMSLYWLGSSCRFSFGPKTAATTTYALPSPAHSRASATTSSAVRLCE